MTPSWFFKKQVQLPTIYKNFQKIAEGGFGEIYLATWQEKTKSQAVIIKRLKPDLALQVSRKTDFENEAKFLQKIKHPHIPHYIDGYFSAEENFIIMEYIQGIDLSQVIRQAEPLPYPLVFHIILQIIHTLSYLHSFQDGEGKISPILHCDIKPKNILLTLQAQSFLIDFSLTVHYAPELKHPGGTYWYMPPERFAGETPTIEMDIFSLMIVFFELLTSHNPLKEKSSFQVFQKLISEKHLEEIYSQKFPKALENLFIKALSLNPEKRFRNTMDLAQTIRHCANQLGISFNADKTPSSLTALIKNLPHST